MPFKTNLQVAMVRHSNDRTLLQQFVYEDEELGFIVVPKGFTTNYASIPTVVPRWWIDQDDRIIRGASVVHDFVYSTKCQIDCTRRQADYVLYRAMLELKASKIKALSALYSVRLCGQSHWKSD